MFTRTAMMCKQGDTSKQVHVLVWVTLPQHISAEESILRLFSVYSTCTRTVCFDLLNIWLMMNEMTLEVEACRPPTWLARLRNVSLIKSEARQTN